MSDLIKSSLKELSQDLNIIQTKRKEIFKKFDVDSKSKILQEIKILKDQAKSSVKLLFILVR
jgi:hypothetical protein